MRTTQKNMPRAQVVRRVIAHQNGIPISTASTTFITLHSWWKEADSPGPSISGTGAITHKLSTRGGVVRHVGPALVVPHACGRRKVGRRDENGFGIFRYSGNRFRNFSIGFIGNGIFRKRNQFLEFSIGIGVEFYRPFSSVTDLCRKLPDLCLGIF